MYEDGPEFDILFHKTDGLSSRRAQLERASQEVDALDEKQILAKGDEEIVAELQEKLSVGIPVLDRDGISFERKMRTRSRQNNWGETISREVPVFYFDVPFEGEEVFFTMRPSSYDLNPPRGRARGNILRVSVEGEEDATKIKQEVNGTLDQVDKYLTWHRELWKGVEDEIAQTVRARLLQRRQRLSTLGQAETGLADLGFKPKEK